LKGWTIKARWSKSNGGMRSIQNKSMNELEKRRQKQSNQDFNKIIMRNDEKPDINAVNYDESYK